MSYETPIEYLYDSIPKALGTISQSEIPTHLPNFVKATRNALGRKSRIILIRESRDLMV
ncbi:hypothetical protein [Abyssogena phaseoliformis symbiont]|uniref:hypothetical protein n=1 Tax=Abyssogena phaseoliformis symbiont TaxID=596095 RepID=UPI0019161594|nr:hypothetical protein [Abyssogena phaseoliformis symbiont]